MPHKNDFRALNSHVKSGWRESALIMRGPLTDRKIEQYRKEGWYSENHRNNRREFQAKQRENAKFRDGNFLRDGDRMIYSPG